MALQSPFFGKREVDAPARATHNAGTSGTPGTAPVLQRPQAPTAPSPVAGTDAAAATREAPPARPGAESQLKVGPLIRLKGVEITDCDTLFVEGTVEATMDSRVMEIAPPGRFKGAAQIDVAEIHGHFEGQLTVRERLVIHPTGRVSGTVRYGKLCIAEGGQISGDVGLLDAAGLTRPATSPSPAEAAVV